MERWMEWRPTVRRIAPTTIASYRAALDRYILPALGKLPVRQVDAATVDAFYARLRTAGGKDGRPLKDSTVHEVHAVLSGALKQAVVWGWIGHNPAKLATAPTVQKADVQPPSAEDAARLLAAAMEEDPELGLFLRLAVMLGARRGELCSLRWPDIDFDHGQVLIAGNVVRVPRQALVHKDTKAHAKRRVAVGAGTLELPRAHRTVSGRAGHADGHMTLATYAHFQPVQDRQAAELMEGLLAFPGRPASR